MWDINMQSVSVLKPDQMCENTGCETLSAQGHKCETLSAQGHKGQQKPPKMKIAKGGKKHSISWLRTTAR